LVEVQTGGFGALGSKLDARKLIENRSTGDRAIEGSILPSLSAMTLSSIGFMALLTCARSRRLGRSTPLGTMGESAARPADG
jgi:hypothetical protein